MNCEEGKGARRDWQARVLAVGVRRGISPAVVALLVAIAEPRVLRRGLLDNGYVELPVTGRHAVNIDSLPALHADPFDRLLVAQAMEEGITLVTGDAQVARYRGPVRNVTRWLGGHSVAKRWTALGT